MKIKETVLKIGAILVMGMAFGVLWLQSLGSQIEPQRVGCELLVYVGENWMDQLAAEDLAKRLKNENFRAKYDARYRPGDIVEVRATGRTSQPVEGCKWRLIRVDGLSFKDAKYLMRPKEDTSDPDNPVLIARRKYRLKVESLPEIVAGLTEVREVSAKWSDLSGEIEDKAVLMAP